jgi:hypothetical protein
LPKLPTRFMPPTASLFGGGAAILNQGSIIGKRTIRRMDKYDVVFKGEVMPNLQVEQVVTALARAFSSTEERVAALFSGEPKVLKAGLERAAAEQYRKVLKQAGAIVYLRRSGLPAKPQGSLKRPPPEAPISIAPVGEFLLRNEERKAVAAVEVDTSALELAAATDTPLQPPAEPTPVQIPTNSRLSLAEPGANLLPAVRAKAKARIVSTIELSLTPAATPAAPSSRADAPQSPDTSHLKIEPQGNILKPHEKPPAPKPPPQAPDFELESPE